MRACECRCIYERVHVLECAKPVSVYVCARLCGCVRVNARFESFACVHVVCTCVGLCVCVCVCVCARARA